MTCPKCGSKRVVWGWPDGHAPDEDLYCWICCYCNWESEPVYQEKRHVPSGEC